MNDLPTPPMAAGANNVQIGGSHYKSANGKQHWDLMALYGGSVWFVGNATKYVYRWKGKNGKEDLLKARHYLDKLIELVAAGQAVPLVAPAFTRPMFQEWVLENGVERQEAEVCRLLWFWGMPDDLKRAKQLLEELIAHA